MTSLLQPTFAGGEISPSLYARVDLARYGTSLRTCRNWLVQRFGGVATRPGFQFLGATRSSATPTRLLPFIYARDLTYIVELGDRVARFWRNGRLVRFLSGGDAGQPVEVATPWSAAEAQVVQFAQAGTVLTVCHPNYAPQDILGGFPEDTWAIFPTPFTPGGITPGAPILTPAGGSAGPPLVHDYVVTLVTNGVESQPSPPASVTTDLQADRPVLVNCGAVAEWNIYRGRNGVYGYIGTSKTDRFLDTNIVPSFGDPPPSYGTPFGLGNFPSNVTYWQQRRWFAATPVNPQTLYGSQTAQFGNFGAATPARASDAIEVTLASQQAQEIRHLVPLRNLVALTIAGEWALDAGDETVITPTNAGFQPQSYYGADRCQPALSGDAAIFVEAGAQRIRDLRLDGGAYRGTDLTVLASHLFRGRRIVDLAWAPTPHGIVWAVRDDGILLALTYLPEQEVWGWSQHVTDGAVERIAVVPENDQDVLYAVIRRTVGGAPVRYLERLTDRYPTDPLAHVCLDAALSRDARYRGTAVTVALTGGATAGAVATATFTGGSPSSAVGAVPTTTDALVLYGEDGVPVLRATVTAVVSPTVFTVTLDRPVPPALVGGATSRWGWAESAIAGLEHLAGRTVSALVDGFVQTGLVVSPTGVVVLDRPGVVVHVGLPYVCDMETLDLTLPGAETLRDKRKSIARVTLYVEGARGLVASANGGRPVPFKERREGLPYDAAPPLVTETIEVRPPTGFDFAGRVRVVQSEPLPATVLSITPEVALGG